MAAIEKAILEGALERGPDPDAEPVRPASPTLSSGGRSDDENEKEQSMQREKVGPALMAPEEADARYSSIWSRQQASQYTGPKGVLSDFRASSSTLDQSFPKALEKLNIDASSVLERDEQDQAEDGLQAWRTRRMQELRSSRVGQGKPASDDAAHFGTFREIGVTNFESAVLEERPEVKVILHVFEPRIPACLVLNLHLANIARDHPETKFLRAQASELDFATEDADVVLPTLLIYQAGDLIGNLVAVDLEWDRSLEYEEEQVTDVLYKHNAIDSRKS